MKRSTLIAVGAFVALLVIVFATREKQVNEGVPKLILPTLDPSQVTKLVTGGANGFELDQAPADGGWTVVDPKTPASPHPADEQQLKPLVTALGDLHVTEFVTDKPEKLTELEIDDAKGLPVSITSNGRPPLELVFGKSPTTGGGNYLRLKGASQVFLAPGNLGPMLKKTPANWRKKGIGPGTLTDFASITVRPADGETFKLIAGEKDSWTLDPTPPATFRFDVGAARRLAGQLSNLAAQDFSTTPIADPKTQIAIELKSGKTVTVAVGKKGEKNLTPVQLEGDPETYLVAGWLGDGIDKRLDDLRDTSLLSIEPEKVTQLTIVSPGKKTVLTRGKDKAFKLTEPKTAPPDFDINQVIVQLNRLRTLHAAKMVSGVDDKKAGLDKATTTLEVQLDGGKKQLVRYGSEAGPNQVYVKGAVDGLTYVTASSEKAQFERGPDLFKKPPPAPPMGAGGMKGLESLPPEVRKQLEAQLRQRQGMPGGGQPIQMAPPPPQAPPH